MQWIHENPARWDDNKAAVLSSAPGVYRGAQNPGGLIAGDWWRVEADGQTVGYGWMDVTWGYAPVLLAVLPAHRKTGVGAFILDRLEDEARARGLAYLFNVIPPDLPDPEAVSSWLCAHRFESSQADGKLLRRQVRGHNKA
jgi:GNAT superfamily N-acetyltransferase